MARKSILSLLLTLALFGSQAEAKRRAVGGRVPETNLSVSEWVTRHAIPFATHQPETGLHDLAPLRSIVRNARVVSLGEATHGTHEFFAMKHRIFEYLVEEMGFTVFAFEAALPECDAINDYVLHGIGDPATALAGQHFWTWNTDEVLDLIVWMRNYNLRRGERPPVQFRGYDMQFSLVAMNEVSAYLDRIDPAGAPAITSRWSCFTPYAENRAQYNTLSDSTRQSCAANIAAAYSTFASRREDYVAKSSAAEYETMLRYMRVLVQHEELVTLPSGAGRSALRDKSMAENVVWLANVAHPGEKLALWAHNYHVGTAYHQTMGNWLRDTFPDTEMVIFGFVFGHGGFNAVPLPQGGGPSPHTLPPWPGVGGIEDMFQRPALPRFVLDLRNIESTAAQNYFKTARTVWTVGAAFNRQTGLDAYREPLILPRAYDAIIWFNETTPSKLRPF